MMGSVLSSGHRLRNTDFIQKLEQDPFCVRWSTAPQKITLQAQDERFFFKIKVLYIVQTANSTAEENTTSVTVVSEVRERCTAIRSSRWDIPAILGRPRQLQRCCRIQKVNGESILSTRDKEAVSRLIHGKRDVVVLHVVYPLGLRYDPQKKLRRSHGPRNLLPVQPRTPSAPPTPPPQKAEVTVTQPQASKPQPQAPPPSLALSSYSGRELKHVVPWLKWKHLSKKVTLQNMSDDPEEHDYGFTCVFVKCNDVSHPLVMSVSNPKQIGSNKEKEELKEHDLMLSVNNTPLLGALEVDGAKILQDIMAAERKITLILQEIEGICEPACIDENGRLVLPKDSPPGPGLMCEHNKLQPSCSKCFKLESWVRMTKESRQYLCHCKAVPCTCLPERLDPGICREHPGGRSTCSPVPSASTAAQMLHVTGVGNKGPSQPEMMPLLPLQTPHAPIGTELMETQMNKHQDSDEVPVTLHSAACPEVKGPADDGTAGHNHSEAEDPPGNTSDTGSGPARLALRGGEEVWKMLQQGNMYARQECQDDQLPMEDVRSCRHQESINSLCPPEPRSRVLASVSSKQKSTLQHHHSMTGRRHLHASGSFTLKCHKRHFSDSELEVGKRLCSPPDKFSAKESFGASLERSLQNILKRMRPFPPMLRLVFVAQDAMLWMEHVYRALGIPRNATSCYLLNSDGSLENVPDKITALCSSAGAMLAELILAKQLAVDLRDSSSDDQLKSALAQLEALGTKFVPQGSKTSVPACLLAHFLCNPAVPAPDAHFVRLENICLSEADLCQLWPVMLFTTRCLYFLKADIASFLQSPDHTEAFLKHALNLIKSYGNAASTVFLLTEKGDLPIQAAIDLGNLISQMAHGNEISMNQLADQPVFLLDDADNVAELRGMVQELLRNPRGWCLPQGYYPQVALAVDRLLRSLTLKTVMVSHIEQYLCDVTKDRNQHLLQQLLCALHDDGSIVYCDKLKLNLCSSPLLQMFALLHPVTLQIHSMMELLCQELSRSPWALTQQTATGLIEHTWLVDRLCLLYSGGRDILAFLKAFGICIPVRLHDRDWIQEKLAYFIPALPTGFQRVAQRGWPTDRKLYVCFEGFVPMTVQPVVLGSMLGNVTAMDGTGNMLRCDEAKYSCKGFHFGLVWMAQQTRTLIKVSVSLNDQSPYQFLAVFEHLFKASLPDALPLPYHIGPACRLEGCGESVTQTHVLKLGSGEAVTCSGVNISQERYVAEWTFQQVDLAKIQLISRCGEHWQLHQPRISMETSLGRLPPSLHLLICKHLLLGAEDGTDWRRLAELQGKNHEDTRILAARHCNNPLDIAGSLLSQWSEKGATLRHLLAELVSPAWCRLGLVMEIKQWCVESKMVVEPELKNWLDACNVYESEL